MQNASDPPKKKEEGGSVATIQNKIKIKVKELSVAPYTVGEEEEEGENE